MALKAILLVNLGTPDAPTYGAVGRYLSEFLQDRRVIDKPWIARQLLVHGLIIPSRIKTSTHSYQAIWTQEGSPLMVHAENVKRLLQERLGEKAYVEIGMRYQSPSLASALERLLAKKPAELIVLPLFPQFASATTGSIFEKIFHILSTQQILPKLTLIDQFHDHPAFIESFRDVSALYNPLSYDHILFSFHGLPERHLKKENAGCLNPGCCTRLPEKGCYAAQCHRTAHLIAAKIGIHPKKYSICFQSRLGKEPWIQPYASDRIGQLAEEGVKNLLVFCPSFVADCLETLYEIGVEYKELFHAKGGRSLDLVPGLNSHPSWIAALEQISLDLNSTNH